jgi:type II secretion system protein N
MTMPDDPKLQRLIFIGTGLFVFVISLVLTFPDKRVKEIAVVQSERLLDNRYDVEIGEFNIWWLGGISFEDISIQRRQANNSKPAGKKKEKNAPAPPPFEITVQSAGVRIAPLASLMNLGIAGAFEIDIGGGNISGTVGRTTSSKFVTVETDELSLQETPMLARATGIPIQGALTTDARFSFAAAKPVVESGFVDISLRELLVGPGKIESDKFGAMAYADVPETDLGNLVGHLEIDKQKNRPPKLNFEKLALEKGRDIRGQVWGHIKLGRSIRSSQAKLQMRFRFQESYVTKNNLNSVLQMKWFREGKRKNWYGFLLWGSLLRPNFKGAPNATKGPSADKKGKKDKQNK